MRTFTVITVIVLLCAGLAWLDQSRKRERPFKCFTFDTEYPVGQLSAEEIRKYKDQGPGKKYASVQITNKPYSEIVVEHSTWTYREQFPEAVKINGKWVNPPSRVTHEPKEKYPIGPMSVPREQLKAFDKDHASPCETMPEGLPAPAGTCGE
jgi:hypothetical protein